MGKGMRLRVFVQTGDGLFLLLRQMSGYRDSWVVFGGRYPAKYQIWGEEILNVFVVEVEA